MTLIIGGTVEPCPPCKIILNGGLMAALAPALAATTSREGVREHAKDLARAADTYVKMLAVLGVTVKVDGEWGGCDQARSLVRWIIGIERPDADLMKTWTDDLWSAIAELAAGKMPSWPPQ